MILTPEESNLVVRRSIQVDATSGRVWEEFSSFARMNAWWGHVVEEPQAGTSRGHWLEVYEPRAGGRIQMAVNLDGSRAAYGGEIIRFEPGTELTFENDWIPGQGWRAPTVVTIRLRPSLDGTLVELFHYGFEVIGDDAATTHAGYERGWGMTQLAELKRIVEAAP
jgi:uncharacterized protein YndB with AHSA1/START domain